MNIRKMNIIYFLILIIILSISSLKEYDKEPVVASDKTFEVENVNNYFTCNEKQIFQNMVIQMMNFWRT
jgi:hypothetical protein